MPPCLSPRRLDLRAHPGDDRLKGSPPRRRRRNRAKNAGLVAQGADDADGLATAGEKQRDVDQHRAAVMDRGTAARHGL